MYVPIGHIFVLGLSFLQVYSDLFSSGQVTVSVTKSEFSFYDKTQEVYSSDAYSESLENSSQHRWYGKGAYIQFKFFFIPMAFLLTNNKI